MLTDADLLTLSELEAPVRDLRARVNAWLADAEVTGQTEDACYGFLSALDHSLPAVLSLLESTRIGVRATRQRTELANVSVAWETMAAGGPTLYPRVTVEGKGQRRAVYVGDRGVRYTAPILDSGLLGPWEADNPYPNYEVNEATRRARVREEVTAIQALCEAVKSALSTERPVGGDLADILSRIRGIARNARHWALGVGNYNRGRDWKRHREHMDIVGRFLHERTEVYRRLRESNPDAAQAYLDALAPFLRHLVESAADEVTP